MQQLTSFQKAISCRTRNALKCGIGEFYDPSSAITTAEQFREHVGRYEYREDLFDSVVGLGTVGFEEAANAAGIELPPSKPKWMKPGKVYNAGYFIDMEDVQTLNRVVAYLSGDADEPEVASAIQDILEKMPATRMEQLT